VSDFNPSTAAWGGPQPPDIQQLAGMLGHLMPLLLRFQSLVQEPAFQGGPDSAIVSNPALDQQAAINLAADITADSLRNLSTYLETNAGQHAGLDSCVPIVTQAAHRFTARDYAQAFNLIWHAYRAIATIRAADPSIPPLQAGGQARSEDTQSIH
jgi:hypothetical protein